MSHPLSITPLPHSHKLCYFISFTQALLTITPFIDSIQKTSRPISSLLKKLTNNTHNPLTTFFEFKKYCIFDLFEHNIENDALIFGEILLTELCFENKKLENFYLLNVEYLYLLSCSHERVIKKDMHFMFVFINKECKLSDAIKSLRLMNVVPVIRNEMCLVCLKLCRVLEERMMSIGCKAFLMVEIEKIYCIDGVYSEFEGKVDVEERLVVDGFLYSFHCALIYRKLHYTVIIREDFKYWKVDGDVVENITYKDAYEICSMYTRMVIYKRV